MSLYGIQQAVPLVELSSAHLDRTVVERLARQRLVEKFAADIVKFYASDIRAEVAMKQNAMVFELQLFVFNRKELDSYVQEQVDDYLSRRLGGKP